jgi:hypothetical protein
MNYTQTLDSLIDRWCERRAIRPLRYLLNAYPGPLVHTDQKFQLLEALRDIKGLCRSDLTDEEIPMLIGVLNMLEDSLRSDTSKK